MWITVEGGDGAGKSTLLERLALHYQKQGREVVRTREPGGTPLGKEIRSLLLETAMTPEAELYLFLADRIEHLERVILPAQRRDAIILCDRYNDSTIAYQGGGRELGIDTVDALCQQACHSRQPDCTLYLDIDPSVGRGRIGRAWDRLESEEISFHQRVREGFLTLAKKYPERITTIDATQSVNEVFEQALAAIEKRAHEVDSV